MLTITFDADLEAMNADELEALNQQMGAYIDEIREYRREINRWHSKRLTEPKPAAPADAQVFPDSLMGGLTNG